MWTLHFESVGLVVGFIMKGSSVSCCCNGVLNQLTRMSLCESREGGRRAERWVDRRTLHGEARRCQASTLTDKTSAVNLQNKTRYCE